MPRSYAHFDGMCWPAPGARLADVEYKLRYSITTLTKTDGMYAASVLAAYNQLVRCPDAAEELPKIRGIIRGRPVTNATEGE